MQNGLFSSLKNWVNQPFNSSMPLLNWFLFLGVVIIAAFIWSRILNKITE